MRNESLNLSPILIWRCGVGGIFIGKPIEGTLAAGFNGEAGEHQSPVGLCILLTDAETYFASANCRRSRLLLLVGLAFLCHGRLDFVVSCLPKTDWIKPDQV
ncbi:MAG: hypothetical protein M2R45_03371 [Verrucomicrobia subdivision 3 bacterium]|nr:hypothetical protein [Limisphaerales bacterium]MCS1416716.1 hypothetical protein [Limisphaerales bacterium]